MRLVALFPRSWRRRYGEEFERLLEETELSPGDLLDLVRGAWDAHIRPQPHLSLGGDEMAMSLTRGLWSAAAALAALVLMVVLVNVPSLWTLSLDPTIIGSAVAAAIFGAAAGALWWWGWLQPLWVLFALLAVRNLELALVGLLVTLPDRALAPLYRNLRPTGYGWLPPTLVEVAAVIALVVVLARFLRLRLVTAVIIGLALELLVGPSDLSLIRFLVLHGLNEFLSFISPVVQGPAMGAPGRLQSAMLDPLSYVAFVGPVVWAVVLKEIALRPAERAVPQPLARGYLAFIRARWAPLAALVVIVVLARFQLPAYLASDVVVNPARFVPSGTDLQAQFRDCLKAYGVDLPVGANTKTAPIPNGVGQRCANIINKYPSQVKGRPLPVPAQVTAGGVTYTITSIRVAGSLLKIDWQASGRPIDEFAAVAYPPRPLSTTLSPTDPRSPSYRFELLQRQYLQAEVLDRTGSRIQGNGGGGDLPRTKPYTWHGQTNALIPGAGEYTLQFGCVSPPPAPTSKGSSDGVCIGGPIATIAIAVSG